MIAWLVGIGIVVFVVVWLAVNVVLPVALLNSALALAVLAFAFKKYKTLFASLALVGGGYMLLDITNGWLSINFVEKVVKNPDWISAFVYINAAAIGLCAWLLIQPIWLKTEKMEPTEKRKSLLLKGSLILLVVFLTSVAPIAYHSVQNSFVKKSIRFNKVTELLLEKNEVIDIDGNVYHTVTIGTQTWMIENLKTTTFNDGQSIPNVPNDTEWINLKTPGYCWYNNDPMNMKSYGALYNWHTINIGKLAPKGWHIPSWKEWSTLKSFLGSGFEVGGGKLKETGTNHWQNPNSLATNETQFTALPGGYRSGTFYDLEVRCGFWSQSDVSNNNAWFVELFYNNDTMSFS